MATEYLSEDDLTQAVLFEYTNAIEAINPDIILNTINSVCREIDELLEWNYRIPLKTIPQVGLEKLRGQTLFHFLIAF
ncbi:phage protein Gp36 family protein [Deltaproteobacteria bacterium TL4]